MIAVYAIAQVKADKKNEFETVVKDLIKASKSDKGCISYNCGSVQGQENTYTFIEQWQSMEDLQSHMKQLHFREAVEKLSAVTSQALDVNVVNLMD